MKTKLSIIVSVAVGICVLLLAGVAWFYGPAIKPLKPEAKVTIKGGGLPPGCTCHSKQAPLVSMHNLFSIEDCRKCHGKKEKLIGEKGSSAMTKERMARLQNRIKNEQICQECHTSGTLSARGKKSKVSGRLFCPVEQKSYDNNKAVVKGGKYYCPKDKKTELVDVDEIAILSAKEPKNEYCIVCHRVNKDLTQKHSKVTASAPDTDLRDCLKCHTSHSKCEGCHF